MKPFELVLDRSRIAQAIADDEALAWVEGKPKLLDSDQIIEAMKEEEWHEIACSAHDLGRVASDAPWVRIAVCPTTVEAEACWTDPAVHVIVVRGIVFGLLEMDGQSRSTAYGITVTQEKERWIASASRLYLALRVAK